MNKINEMNNKLIFKIYFNERNDNLFIKDYIIDLNIKISDVKNMLLNDIC
jgi:hypothetical protein